MIVTSTEIGKYQEEDALLKRQIEERTGQTVEQLYAERAKRVRDAIELRVPDRAPFSVLIEPHVYSGIPNSAAYYDPMAVKRTMRKMAVELEPDMCEAGFPPEVLRWRSWTLETAYGLAARNRLIMDTSSSKRNT